MDLRPSIDVVMTAFGLAATITLPDADPVPAVAFWLPPRTVEVPSGEFRRSEVQHRLVLRRAEVPLVPRGTVVSVPEVEGGEPQDWVVDGIDRTDAEHHRCIVVPA